MNRLLWITVLLVAAVVLLGFSTRISDTHYVDFRDGVALGWLNQDDGREHPMKGAYTVNKFGRNQDSDTTEDSIADISDFGGPIRCFTVPSAAAAIYISSDDAADAGLSVTVEALDANWKNITIVQLLGADTGATGTEFVQLGSVDLLRVNRAYPTTTAAAGDIYIHIDSVDAAAKDGIPDTLLTDIVAMIDKAEQQTMQACYSVPDNFDCLLYYYEVDNFDTIANAAGTFRIRAAINGGSARTKMTATVAESSYRFSSYGPPVRFVEKTDIELTNTGSQNNGSVTGRFDLMCVPNNI